MTVTWVVGNQKEIYWRRMVHSDERRRTGGTTRECRRKSGVRPLYLKSSKPKFRHSLESWSPRRQEARARKSFCAAERVEDVRKTAVKKKIEGECEPQPGQPGRSDHENEIPALPVKKRANSRKRQIIVAVPDVIEGSIEGASAVGTDWMRGKSARETRGSGRVTAADTVRW